jgi:hypothetical protein
LLRCNIAIHGLACHCIFIIINYVLDYVSTHPTCMDFVKLLCSLSSTLDIVTINALTIGFGLDHLDLPPHFV